MSIPGILFEFGGKLLGDAIGKAVAEKAGQQAGDLVGGGVEETTKFVGEGPANYAMEHSPQEYVRKKTSDMANDAIMSGLHHLPGFKQLLDGIDETVATIPENAKRSSEVYKDVTVDRMKLPESIKKHFGTEDLHTVNRGLKQLRDMNFKVSPEEQQITQNLVKSQRKVFDILHDTEELIKTGDFTEDEIKQIHSDMEDKVTEAYAEKRVYNKKGDSLNYHEGLNKQHKNMLNHIYDYPKPGNIVTKVQRENVFRAIEKDIGKHDTRGARATVNQYRDGAGTSLKYTPANQKSLKFLLDTETDIGVGKIYIDELGKLRMVGSENIDAKIKTPGTGSKPGFLSSSEMIADIVANSETIPQETKDMLLKDFKRLKRNNKVFTQTGEKGAIKTIHRGEVGLDRVNEPPKLNPDFVRNAESKKAYAELQEQLKLGGLDDLPASEVVNPTDIYDNPRKPYNTYLKKPDLVESTTTFRAKTPKIDTKSIEDLGAIMGPDNVILNWDKLKSVQPQIEKEVKIRGLDVKTPELKRFKDFENRTIKNISENKDVSDIDKGLIKNTIIDGLKVDSISKTSALEKLRFDSIMKPSEELFETDPTSSISSKISTDDVDFKRKIELTNAISREENNIKRIKKSKIKSASDTEKIATSEENIKRLQQEFGSIDEPDLPPSNISKSGQIQLTETQLDTKQKAIEEIAETERLETEKQIKEDAKTKKEDEFRQNQQNKAREEDRLRKLPNVKKKYQMTKADFLDKNLYNFEQLNKRKLNGDFFKDAETIKELKKLGSGDTNFTTTKIKNLIKTEANVLKLRNSVNTLLEEQDKAFADNPELERPPEPEFVEDVLKNPDAKPEKLRGGNLNPLDVAENVATKGTTFSTSGGELEKLEQESKDLQAQKSTKPEKKIFTSDNQKFAPDLQESKKQLTDGTFFIKDIDDFLKLDKE